ncbi:hypothetical protein V2E24_01140 [Mycoplasmopsis ciconiae]|uniref:ECM-binding protein homolog n=1 Tax=Mycoplasmopsis ciconiae TaxID=561067 RepID=A0ABU7MKY3_9BACT|nr:hypothetical protein [Mycoplasmopsis ciconiae]
MKKNKIRNSLNILLGTSLLTLPFLSLSSGTEKENQDQNIDTNWINPANNTQTTEEYNNQNLPWYKYKGVDYQYSQYNWFTSENAFQEYNFQNLAFSQLDNNWNVSNSFYQHSYNDKFIDDSLKIYTPSNKTKNKYTFNDSQINTPGGFWNKNWSNFTNENENEQYQQWEFEFNSAAMVDFNRELNVSTNYDNPKIGGPIQFIPQVYNFAIALSQDIEIVPGSLIIGAIKRFKDNVPVFDNVGAGTQGSGFKPFGPKGNWRAQQVSRSTEGYDGQIIFFENDEVNKSYLPWIGTNSNISYILSNKNNPNFPKNKSPLGDKIFDDLKDNPKSSIISNADLSSSFDIKPNFVFDSLIPNSDSKNVAVLSNLSFFNNWEVDANQQNANSFKTKLTDKLFSSDVNKATAASLISESSKIKFAEINYDQIGSVLTGQLRLAKKDSITEDGLLKDTENSDILPTIKVKFLTRVSRRPQNYTNNSSTQKGSFVSSIFVAPKSESSNANVWQYYEQQDNAEKPNFVPQREASYIRSKTSFFNSSSINENIPVTLDIQNTINNISFKNPLNPNQTIQNVEPILKPQYDYMPSWNKDGQTYDWLLTWFQNDPEKGLNFINSYRGGVEVDLNGNYKNFKYNFIWNKGSVSFIKNYEMNTQYVSSVIKFPQLEDGQTQSAFFNVSKRGLVFERPNHGNTFKNAQDLKYKNETWKDEVSVSLTQTGINKDVLLRLVKQNALVQNPSASTLNLANNVLTQQQKDALLSGLMNDWNPQHFSDSNKQKWYGYIFEINQQSILAEQNKILGPKVKQNISTKITFEEYSTNSKYINSLVAYKFSNKQKRDNFELTFANLDKTKDASLIEFGADKYISQQSLNNIKSYNQAFDDALRALNGKEELDKLIAQIPTTLNSHYYNQIVELMINSANLEEAAKFIDASVQLNNTLVQASENVTKYTNIKNNNLTQTTTKDELNKYAYSSIQPKTNFDNSLKNLTTHTNNPNATLSSISDINNLKNNVSSLNNDIKNKFNELNGDVNLKTINNIIEQIKTKITEATSLSPAFSSLTNAINTAKNDIKITLPHNNYQFENLKSTLEADLNNLNYQIELHNLKKQAINTLNQQEFLRQNKKDAFKNQINSATTKEAVNNALNEAITNNNFKKAKYQEIVDLGYLNQTQLGQYKEKIISEDAESRFVELATSLNALMKQAKVRIDALNNAQLKNNLLNEWKTVAARTASVELILKKLNAIDEINQLSIIDESIKTNANINLSVVDNSSALASILQSTKDLNNAYVELKNTVNDINPVEFRKTNSYKLANEDLKTRFEDALNDAQNLLNTATNTDKNYVNTVRNNLFQTWAEINNFSYDVDLSNIIYLTQKESIKLVALTQDSQSAANGVKDLAIMLDNKIGEYLNVARDYAFNLSQFENADFAKYIEQELLVYKNRLNDFNLQIETISNTNFVNKEQFTTLQNNVEELIANLSADLSANINLAKITLLNEINNVNPTLLNEENKEILAKEILALNSAKSLAQDLANIENKALNIAKQNANALIVTSKTLDQNQKNQYIAKEYYSNFVEIEQNLNEATNLAKDNLDNLINLSKIPNKDNFKQQNNFEQASDIEQINNIYDKLIEVAKEYALNLLNQTNEIDLNTKEIIKNQINSSNSIEEINDNIDLINFKIDLAHLKEIYDQSQEWNDLLNPDTQTEALKLKTNLNQLTFTAEQILNYYQNNLQHSQEDVYKVSNSINDLESINTSAQNLMTKTKNNLSILVQSLEQKTDLASEIIPKLNEAKTLVQDSSWHMYLEYIKTFEQLQDLKNKNELFNKYNEVLQLENKTPKVDEALEFAKNVINTFPATQEQIQEAIDKLNYAHLNNQEIEQLNEQKQNWSLAVANLEYLSNIEISNFSDLIKSSTSLKQAQSNFEKAQVENTLKQQLTNKIDSDYPNLNKDQISYAKDELKKSVNNPKLLDSKYQNNTFKTSAQVIEEIDSLNAAMGDLKTTKDILQAYDLNKYPASDIQIKNISDGIELANKLITNTPINKDDFGNYTFVEKENNNWNKAEVNNLEQELKNNLKSYFKDVINNNDQADLDLKNQAQNQIEQIDFTNDFNNAITEAENIINNFIDESSAQKPVNEDDSLKEQILQNLKSLINKYDQILKDKTQDLIAQIKDDQTFTQSAKDSLLAIEQLNNLNDLFQKYQELDYQNSEDKNKYNQYINQIKELVNNLSEVKNQLNLENTFDQINQNLLNKIKQNTSQIVTFVNMSESLKSVNKDGFIQAANKDNSQQNQKIKQIILENQIFEMINKTQVTQEELNNYTNVANSQDLPKIIQSILKTYTPKLQTKDNLYWLLLLLLIIPASALIWWLIAAKKKKEDNQQ